MDLHESEFGMTNRWHIDEVDENDITPLDDT